MLHITLQSQEAGGERSAQLCIILCGKRDATGNQIGSLTLGQRTPGHQTRTGGGGAVLKNWKKYRWKKLGLGKILEEYLAEIHAKNMGKIGRLQVSAKSYAV